MLLSGNTDSLGLTTAWQSFALDENDTNRPMLKLYEFSQPATDYFCDDVIEAEEDPIQEWDAEAGTVRLRIAQEANEIGVYEIDIVLLDIVINDLQLERIERNNVEVGWFPG